MYFIAEVFSSALSIDLHDASPRERVNVHGALQYIVSRHSHIVACHAVSHVGDTARVLVLIPIDYRAQLVSLYSIALL